MSAQTSPDPERVLAAGGVVWRARGVRGDDVEVLIVHRPKRSDWSFPKGKLDPGESFEDAAVREVEEETGYRCRLGADLGSTCYRDQKGRPKTVRWWSMRIEGGDFVANDEVDQVQWCPVQAAETALTWPSDHQVLQRFRSHGLTEDPP